MNWKKQLTTFPTVTKLMDSVIATVVARYESAYQKWGERSWLPASLQDMRQDYDASTRKELQRRSRYWERNNGICQRICDVFVQFTVGPNGLQMIPDSSDEDFNQSAADYWAMVSQSLNLLTPDDFGVEQQTMARSLFFDGEVFIQKVTGPGNRPKIVQLEAHRVETPPDRSGEENKTICDGVKINSAGQVLGYYVRTSLDKSELEYKFIPVAEIVHRFVRKRPGQYRGIPFLYPVMNDLHDLDDLQMYEMRAAKDAAIISNVVTNASGEKSAATLRRSRAQIQSQNPNSMPVIKNDDQFYDVQFGTRTVMLKTGEDIKQFRSARPSVTTREYWDYLVAKICAGVGVSRLLVFPFSIQGTVTRADLDISAGLFRTRSKIVESICRDIYEWVIDWAIKYDQRLDGEPQDGTALCVTSHPPRSPNVDVGRNSSAMLAELEAGTRTFQDVYAELGEDWRPQLRQKAKERAYIHALAKQYSTADAPIDPNEIAGTTMTPIAPDPTERSSSSSPTTTATP